MTTPSKELETSKQHLILVEMPAWKRFLYVAATASMWAILLYLCQDVPKALIALLVDAEMIIERGWETEPLRDTGRLILQFGAITLGLIILFALWSLINHLRFGHLKRRKRPEDISVKELAASFGTTSETIHELRKAKIVTVSIDQSGRIIRAI